jgi:hypothetical protein
MGETLDLTPPTPSVLDAIRRAIRERRARIEISPAIRVHVTTDDGYEAHYATQGEDCGAPCDNYVLTPGLDEGRIPIQLADAIHAAFAHQIDEALDGSAAETERLADLTRDLADEDERPTPS